ncbi:Maltooligosyl trehalose synthase [Planctomyces sp. SH-PL14]|nr:Maltooligosyl trehalose synthase [Planctomyces sp. SH-PL14]
MRRDGEPAAAASSDETLGERSRATPLVDEVLGRLQERRTWSATYRLQMRKEFGYSPAAAIVDYLADLGVSHVYSSPQLQSRSGSAHGYDVTDHSHRNTELGAEADYSAFVARLRENGLGCLLDIVPNHMCVAGDANGWWLDVLTHGPASRFSHYFDIDWEPVKRELAGKVLLPVLGDFYGKVLEAGQLPIEFDEGRFFVRVYEARLPIDPRTSDEILRSGLDEFAATAGPEAADVIELQSILTAIQHLPPRHATAPEKVAERYRESVVISNRLQRLASDSSRVAEHVQSAVARINGRAGDPPSFDALDRLLLSQAYALVYWKAGSDEMNYRRFFDVTELAAVCTESVDVFEATHDVVLKAAVAGEVDGFRIDHIDGLLAPTTYLWRLQWAFLERLGKRVFDDRLSDEESWEEVRPDYLARLHERLAGPAPQSLFLQDRQENKAADSPANSGSPVPPAAAFLDSPEIDVAAPPAGPTDPSVRDGALPLYVTVEKILGPSEDLPPEWPVAGTSGYDYLNQINGLFVDPRGLRTLHRHYERFVDLKEDFHETVYLSKRLILSSAMQSEVQLLAHRLDRLSHRHRRSRDYTLQALRAALREIIACFSVYRTYIHDGYVSEIDRKIVQRAAAMAKRRNPALESSVFDFVRDVLLLEQPLDLNEDGRRERDLFVGRFQQVTSPVMAKGVEDTAFYRYVPLLSLEEVGGEPIHAVTSIQSFHDQNVARQAKWPGALLATTTHDTKRTEDVRARLSVLSEAPGEWRSALQRWTRLNRRYRREVDGLPAPSRNDEWLFYQTLVGIWPLVAPDEEQLKELTARLIQYMEKATHEAKLRTSWISPNPAYDDAVRQFVTEVLADRSGRFLADVERFVRSIAPAGLWNSASQVLLKTLSPGIPDLYQGQELWDFSLVDPDNRRPVDYDLRRKLLGELRSRITSPADRGDFARELAAAPENPLLKLYVTHAALQVRQSDAFLDAEYVPLPAEGDRAGHVCAFGWRRPGSKEFDVIVVAPRLVHAHGKSSESPVASLWSDTRIPLPDVGTGDFVNVFTGGAVDASTGEVRLEQAFADFPLALLCPGPAESV